MSQLRRRIILSKSKYRQTSIFQFMTDDEFESVWNGMDCIAHEKGSVLYREESELHGVFLVLEGILKQAKSVHHKRPHILSLVNAGEVLGFRSLLTNELACTTTQALTEAVVCHIYEDVFINTIKSNPVLLKFLLEKACAELDETQSHIVDIAQKNVRERTAKALISLKSKFELAEDNSLQIQLSRDEFASVVGTVPESVSRVLSEFKADKLIEVRRSQIKLLNVPELVRISNIRL